MPIKMGCMVFVLGCLVWLTMARAGDNGTISCTGLIGLTVFSVMMMIYKRVKVKHEA